MKKAIISPESLYVLCDTPTPQKETVREPSAVPKLPFWKRVGGFFKKIAPMVRSVLNTLSVCASVLNAVSRFRSSSHCKPVGAMI